MKKTRKNPAPSQANGSMISAYFRDENVKSNSKRNTSKNFIPFTNKFAIKDTTAPIVNPPQVAIMSFDGIIKKPVIIDDENGDKIGIRKMGVLGQSFDHRAFDGAYAASFLKEVKTIIEDYNWQSEI